MAENASDSKASVRKLTFKALKATIKGLLFYAVYFVLWTFIAPFASMVPGLQQSIEIFVVVYIVLIIIGEFMAGTIYQYFFGAGKALFVIFYMILSLRNGVMSLAFENLSLLIDLRFFIGIAMVLSLLGFAGSVLQAINFVSNRSEATPV
jgi:hypothetical protein